MLGVAVDGVRGEGGAEGCRQLRAGGGFLLLRVPDPGDGGFAIPHLLHPVGEAAGPLPAGKGLLHPCHPGLSKPPQEKIAPQGAEKHRPYGPQIDAGEEPQKKLPGVGKGQAERGQQPHGDGDWGGPPPALFPFWASLPLGTGALGGSFWGMLRGGGGGRLCLRALRGRGALLLRGGGLRRQGGLREGKDFLLGNGLLDCHGLPSFSDKLRQLFPIVSCPGGNVQIKGYQAWGRRRPVRLFAISKTSHRHVFDGQRDKETKERPKGAAPPDEPPYLRVLP